jgi:hypothetical protein
LTVLTDLHNRGVEDFLVACIDGLTGFPVAIGYLSKNGNSTLHHSSDPKLAEIRGLEKPESLHD